MNAYKYINIYLYKYVYIYKYITLANEHLSRCEKEM